MADEQNQEMTVEQARPLIHKYTPSLDGIGRQEMLRLKGVKPDSGLIGKV
jgi:hypothetical protein